MRVCMVGAGYVGLVSAACLAEIGHHVVCVDRDQQKIGTLNGGGVPIHELGLPELLARNSREGRLQFTTELNEAIAAGCTMFFIAVDTPYSYEFGTADLSSVNSVVDAIAAALRRSNGSGPEFATIVIKSTVPPGTTEKIDQHLAQSINRSRFAVASNPEFLREGLAVQDFLEPYRVVCGSVSERAREELAELYRPITQRGYPMLMTDSVQSAELIKYASNSFLATKIAFINELSHLCDRTGANIDEIARGMGLDKRIGLEFFKVGPGYGGSCFPKDTRAITSFARKTGVQLSITEAVVNSNESHRASMVEKIAAALGGNLNGKRIAALGLAFKAGTDDVRESPALKIAVDLAERGAELAAYDPVAMANARSSVADGQISYMRSLKEAVAGADAAVILTDWDQFLAADWAVLARTMRRPLLIDLRNMFSLDEGQSLPMTYISIGRGAVARAMA